MASPDPPFLVPSWLETNAFILAATGAITLASHRALQSCLAVASLTPPSLPPYKSKPGESPPSRLSRFTSQLVGIGIPGLIGWCIPQYGTKPIVNVFYLLMGFGFLQNAIHAVIVRSVQRSYSLFFEYSTPDDPSTKVILRNTRSETMSRIASLTLAAVLLSLAYLELLPAPLIRVVLPSLFIFYFLLHFFPYMSVRRLTYILLGEMALIFLVIGVISFIAIRFAKNKSTRTNVFPSDWMCDLARAATPSVFICQSFFITTLTFRYEYVRAHGLPERLAPGEHCPVPTSLKPFRPVLAASSLVLFAAAEYLARGVAPRYLPSEWAREMMYPGTELHIFLLAPVVIATIATAAWMRGELADWWNYSETWIPKAELDTANGVNDDEKAVSGIAEDAVHRYDEKTPLLDASVAAKS